MRSALTAIALIASAATAWSAPAEKPLPAWYAKAVKSFEAKFEPAEAKPGQTVTLKVTLALAPGHYTYATKQTDKVALELGIMNGIKYPEAGSVIFVGETIDPPNPKLKAMPELGIKSLKTYSGTLTYERAVVVNPAQQPGEFAVKIPEVRLNICNANDCFPMQKLPLEATLKVLAGPALSIDEKYADEVKKALEKK